MAEEWSIEEVEEFAEDYGIKLTKNYEETSEYPVGTIIKQSRAAGTTVVNGARLTVTIARAVSNNIEEPNNSGDLD